MASHVKALLGSVFNLEMTFAENIRSNVVLKYSTVLKLECAHVLASVIHLDAVTFPKRCCRERQGNFNLLRGTFTPLTFLTTASSHPSSDILSYSAILMCVFFTDEEAPPKPREAPNECLHGLVTNGTTEHCRQNPRHAQRRNLKAAWSSLEAADGRAEAALQTRGSAIKAASSTRVPKLQVQAEEEGCEMPHCHQLSQRRVHQVQRPHIQT